MKRIQSTIAIAVALILSGCGGCSGDSVGGSASCADSTDCAVGEVCEAESCRATVSCVDSSCGMFRLCDEATDHADAVCLDACEAGYVWQASTSSCEEAMCADLDCTAQNRECDDAATPATCGVCLFGFIEDAGSCRAPMTCADITCAPPNDVCVDATETTDATCASGCPANSIPASGGTVCYPCPACDDASAGEDGSYLAAATLENKCICQTLPGFFWREAGFPGVSPCDADGDGWVRESAKPAIDAAPGTAIKVNARCDLRRVDSFTLQNEDGERLAVPLDPIVDLYETDRNDDQVLLDQAITNGDLGPYGDGGRTLEATEMNSLTKACVDAQADYNENSMADVNEWHGNGDTASVKSTLLPFIDFAYFIELHRSWYEPGAGTLGTYVIAEKTRMTGAAAGELVAIDHDTNAGTYWRECVRFQDADFFLRQGNGDELYGMDFLQHYDTSTWAGMTHHSQFKCLQVVDQPDPAPHRLTVAEIQGTYIPNDCVASGMPNGPVAGEDSANPSDPELTCSLSDLGTLTNGDVRLAVLNYMNYETPGGYTQGCVNECIEFADMCPGWNSDPVLDASQCEGDIFNSGQLFCGCGLNFGGLNCEIGCPGDPLNPSTVANVFVEPGYLLAPRTGYWMCGGFTGTSFVDPTDPRLSESGGGYTLTGTIPVQQPSTDLLCQTPGDCGVGYAISK